MLVWYRKLFVWYRNQFVWYRKQFVWYRKLFVWYRKQFQGCKLLTFLRNSPFSTQNRSFT